MKCIHIQVHQYPTEQSVSKFWYVNILKSDLNDSLAISISLHQAG